MNLKALAILSLSLPLVVQSAPLELVSPREGAVVPTLSDGQKSFVGMPRKERVAYFASKTKRAEMKAMGYYPQPIRLEWKGGAAGATYKVEVKRASDGKRFFAWEGKETHVEVDNLEIAREWEWSVTGGGELKAKFKTEDLAPRLLRVPGVPNVRDLGGRIGLDGRRVKQGIVIRTAGLNENATTSYMTRNEMEKAGKITPDFLKKEKAIKDHMARYRGYQADPGKFPRTKHKGWLAYAKKNPSATVADYFKVRLGDDEKALTNLCKVVKARKPGKNRVPEASEGRDYLLNTIGVKSDIDLRSDGECYGMKGSPLGDSVTWFHYSSSAYAGMQTKEGKAAFTKVFKVFLDEKNYPIDFHCIAGQDRTGAVAFIINGLLGVCEEQLYLDWEVTGFWNGNVSFCHSKRFDKLVAGFAKLPGANLNEKIENYVLSLGFTKDDIAKLRSIMLE